jgi:hypothetical protein
MESDPLDPRQRHFLAHRAEATQGNIN